MKLPKLAELNTTREVIQEFRGINETAEIAENEFVDTLNLSSDNYPLLSTRKKRYRLFPQFNKVQGAIECDDYYVYLVNNGELYRDEGKVEGITLSPDSTKSFLIMGAFLLIFPDRKYYNRETGDVGDIENITDCFVNGVAQPLTITPKEKDGTAIDAPQKVESPVDGAYRHTSADMPIEKWSESQGMWMPVESYVTFRSDAPIGKGFKKGDTIKIALNDETWFFRDSEHLTLNESIHALMGFRVIVECNENEITIAGATPATFTHNLGAFSFSRTMPTMDTFVVHNNRLWGARCWNGVNEIYASKLGDFTNWNSFEGLSTDSYVASCGADGRFTGATVFRGRPLFFKEKFVHTIYGDVPANFQIQTTPVHGVKTFGHASFATIDNVLYYMSSVGLCAYDGESCEIVSREINDIHDSGVLYGVALKDKYYLNGLIEDEDNRYGNRKILVYDARRKIWHKENCDELGEGMALFRRSSDIMFIEGGKLYGIVDRRLRQSEMPSELLDEKVKWAAETGMIGIWSPEQKYLSRLNVQLSLELGAKATIYIQYDSIGEWKQICNLSGHKPTSVNIPIRPKRCNHMRLRLEGEGDVKIYSIVKTFEWGSDNT